MWGVVGHFARKTFNRYGALGAGKMIYVAEKKLTTLRNKQHISAYSVVSSILTGQTPGYELNDEAHPNAIENFVVLSVRGSPRLLLPPERSIMHSAIKNFLGNRRGTCLLYTSPSPRDQRGSRMPSSA